MSLEIKNLKVNREGKEIVLGVSLTINPGEVHVLMGPNGSGKSSLANSLMGHPKSEVVAGSVELDGEDLLALKVDARARAGLFLSMQHTPELPGVGLVSFLRAAVNAKREKPIGVAEFHGLLKETMKELGIDPSFASRTLNEGFSGGERKRMEVLQLLLLKPKYAILDETDSGLDVDALKIVVNGIEKARANGTGVLVITHYTQLVKDLRPEKVYVMVGGKIAKSGGSEIGEEIEKDGYAKYGN